MFNDQELAAAKRFIANTVEALWDPEYLTEAEQMLIGKRVYAFLREEVALIERAPTVFRQDSAHTLAGLHDGSAKR